MDLLIPIVFIAIICYQLWRSTRFTELPTKLPSGKIKSSIDLSELDKLVEELEIKSNAESEEYYNKTALQRKKTRPPESFIQQHQKIFLHKLINIQGKVSTVDENDFGCVVNIQPTPTNMKKLPSPTLQFSSRWKPALLLLNEGESIQALASVTKLKTFKYTAETGERVLVKDGSVSRWVNETYKSSYNEFELQAISIIKGDN